MVINDHAIANNSVIQRAAIDVVHAPISTRSPIITRPICGISPSYHDRWHNQSRLHLPLFRLDQAILTDLDLMVNGYVRPRREPAPILLFLPTKQPAPIIRYRPVQRRTQSQR